MLVATSYVSVHSESVKEERNAYRPEETDPTTILRSHHFQPAASAPTILRFNPANVRRWLPTHSQGKIGPVRCSIPTPPTCIATNCPSPVVASSKFDQTSAVVVSWTGWVGRKEGLREGRTGPQSQSFPFRRSCRPNPNPPQPIPPPTRLSELNSRLRLTPGRPATGARAPRWPNHGPPGPWSARRRKGSGPRCDEGQATAPRREGERWWREHTRSPRRKLA